MAPRDIGRSIQRLAAFATYRKTVKIGNPIRGDFTQAELGFWYERAWVLPDGKGINRLMPLGMQAIVREAQVVQNDPVPDWNKKSLC